MKPNFHHWHLYVIVSNYSIDMFSDNLTRCLHSLLLLQALEVNPKDSACLTARAASKFEAGDYEGALEDAQTARDIDRRNAKVAPILR